MRLLTLGSVVMMLTFHHVSAQKLAAKATPKLSERATVLEGRCAVIVRPDNRKIALMKKQGSEEDYNTVVADNQYYMGISLYFLDSVKVRQIEKPAHGVIIFKSSTGHYFTVSLTPFDWGIILFNGRAKPIEADVTDIESSYRAYMKK
ncbi:hypothetical protein J4D99_14765 [Siccationidurans ginsengisoli]|nr:hypothetical protein [Hymenobacter sp. BT559]